MTTATVKTITGQIIGADGIKIAGTVYVQLSRSGFVNGWELLDDPIVVATAPDGSYTLTLYSNSDITPANTTYTVTESVQPDTGAPVAHTMTIVVPSSAGPFALANIVQ